MAYDFSTLKTRIANDLDRSDLTSEINEAVLDAVEEKSGERFFFNESGGFTLPLVDGTEEYAVSAWSLDGTAQSSSFDTIIEPDELWISISGKQHWMRPVEWSEMEHMSRTSPQEGQPFQWAYYNQKWRFYPVPDQAFTVTMQAHYRLKRLSANDDENAWTNQARRMIGAAAKGILYAEVLNDDRNAAKMDVLIDRYERRLKKETAKKASRNRIVVSNF